MRSFAFAVIAVAVVSCANARAADADAAPEKFLPQSTQLFLRWDGITAHNDAYKKSVWGPVMAGPTGDSVRAVLGKVPKLLGGSVLADPLLAGKSPKELKANLADFKAAEKLIDLIADHGVIVAAEVREPAPTLKGIGQAFGGLLGGKLPGAEAVMPDAQLIVMVPNVGDKVEVLYGSIRLAMRQGDNQIKAFSAGGRSGFMFIPPEGGGGPPFPVHAAWWLEGKHFVFYFGTRKTETIIDEMKANATKGGITNNPLYQRAQKLGNFESVTRGFVNTASLVGMAKTLAGPFVPGLRERLDNVGLSSIKALVFTSGFDGKESRAIYEFDAPGERQGIAKVLKNKPLSLDDLPPMPPDVSRFAALRLDPEATYDAAFSLVDLFDINSGFGENDPKKSPAELIKENKEAMKREVDKFLGISVKDDLMPHLGDKLVIYQSPLEGLSVFGTVVCISCKDPAKVKAATDRVQRALEAIANSPIKVRKKMVKGVEVREFSSRGFGVLTPSYAVVGDWLVIAGYPQAVNGLILRTKGDLEKWKPDAETIKRLAKLPADACGIQYCNAKSSAQNLCCVGPLLLAQIEQTFRFREAGETDFEPLDTGLIPNAHEISKHLFPNLTVTRDDGKTIRIEVNESFSVPLEFIGVEPLIVFGAIFGLRF